LLGSLSAGFFGRLLGFRGAALITTGFVFFAFILSCGAFYEVALCASPCYIKLAPWFGTEMIDACWGFLFDSLTVVMCVVVTLVSSLGAGCTPQQQSRRFSAGAVDSRASWGYEPGSSCGRSVRDFNGKLSSTGDGDDFREGFGLRMYRITNPTNKGALYLGTNPLYVGSWATGV